MALLTKSNIAEMLRIGASSINDNIYTLAKSQFFILTNLKEAEVSKTLYRFLGRSTTWLQLPDTNIKEITSITIGTESAEVSAASVSFNPDSGLLNYSGGFLAGYLIKIVYKVNAFIFADIHNYLLTLLVLKQVALFTPSVVDNISSFRIGRYSKNFGTAAKSQEEFQEGMDTSIKQAIALINGDDGQLEIGNIV